MANVEIYIRDNTTGAYLQIPVLPETIAYKDGDVIGDAVKIINFGNVIYSDGVDLDTISWESFFPARYDAAYCTIANFHDILTYRNIFSSWKDAHTSLQVICPAANLNKNMEITGFEWSIQGAELDLHYTVQFREVKTVQPIQISVIETENGIIPLAALTPGPESRPPIADETAPSTWTVKDGDTLDYIAKKIGISGGWRAIYNLNKDIISDPNIIQVGQVLKLT